VSSDGVWRSQIMSFTHSCMSSVKSVRNGNNFVEILNLQIWCTNIFLSKVECAFSCGLS
jgi:hypothetical protein